jgi:hypothetical protein
MFFSLAENAKIVEALTPATDAAGRTGAWVSTATAGRVAITFHVAQGNAATILLSVLQAQDVNGTGSKAGPTCQVYTNLNCAAADALARQTDGSTYTTDAGVEHKIVIFEFDPSGLDVTNGFAYVTISTGASNVANLTSAKVFLLDLRYQQKITPTAVV